MRFSPTKFLHSLVYTVPVMLLTLVACGGGGGSDTALASAYTLGGTMSGLTNNGLVLRNNGGDDLSVASGVTSFTFSTPVIAANNYNVTVLTHPNSPPQKCTVSPATASGVMPAYDLATVAVNCVGAHTIGGTLAGSGGITGLTGTGLVLQNDGGDNLLITPAGGTIDFAFLTPVVDGSYFVTILTQPKGQSCSPTSTPVTVSGSSINNLSITCGAIVTPPPEDPYVYAANFGSTGTNGVSTYTSASGMLSTQTLVNSGSGPSSITVDPASQFAYVTNYNSNTISAYSINSGTGALTLLTDVDAGTPGNQTSIATGSHPYSIAIHPSGNFAYVTNYSSNSVSAYSIDSAGALSRIDANGSVTGTNIATRTGPISIAIDPTGSYAYVANAVTNDVSAYSIDGTSGVLTAFDASAGIGSGGQPYISTGGPAPYSITVDPTGQYLYVVNVNDNTVAHFDINITNGGLTRMPCTPGPGCSATQNTYTGVGPHSVTAHPGGGYVYVVNTTDEKVWVYTINGTGEMTHTASATTEVATGGSPIAISVDSTGQYAYVVNSGTSDISVYSIDGAGGLTLIGSVTAAGNTPYAVTTAR